MKKKIEENVVETKKCSNKSLIILELITIALLSGFIAFEVLYENKNRDKNTCYCTKCLTKVDSSVKDNTKEKENVAEDKKLNSDSVSTDVKIINFDKDKCINCDLNKEGYEFAKNLMSKDFDGIYFHTDIGNEKIVNVQVRYDILNPDKYGETDPNTGVSATKNDDVTLKFNKEVEDIFAGTFSPDLIEGTVYFFLMKDGTLEYMKFKDIYENEKFEHKPINGVSGIVKFDSIIYSKDTTTKNTVIAYKMDGSFYDLSKYIKLS